MGYRSDVVAIFYATDKGGEEHREFNKRNRVKLKLFMEENFPKYWRGTGNELDDCLTMLDTPSRLIFEFKVSHVKWYEDYPEVVAFDQFWDKFRELVEENASMEMDINQEPCEWSCEFVRLGENTEDIEEKSIGDSDWLLQVNRYIETNY